MKNILRLSVLHGWFFIPAAPGLEGRVSTSGRRPAKRKWQDGMFRVYKANGQPLTDSAFETVNFGVLG